MKLAVVPERCSGCKTCEVVCSMTHFNVVNPKKSRLRVMVMYPQPIIRMPIVCSQCVDPDCAKACKLSAITRSDGIVKINSDKCISCRDCISACPYGAIHTHPDIDLPFKCDLCGGDPECVKACPKDAILYLPRRLVEQPQTFWNKSIKFIEKTLTKEPQLNFPDNVLGQPQRMKNLLKYAHMQEVEYTQNGERKILRYTETTEKGTKDAS